MKNLYTISFGWRYNQHKELAVIRKRSKLDFLISIVMAFLIIFIISQLLGQLDKSVQSSLGGKKYSDLNPFSIKVAQAASSEAVKIIQSQKDFNLVRGQKINLTIGYKNLGTKVWKQSGLGKVQLKYGSVLISMNDKQVKPGQIAYYTFNLSASAKAGSYNQSFVLVRNGKEQIVGSKLSLPMKVFNSNIELVQKTKPATPVTAVKVVGNSTNSNSTQAIVASSAANSVEALKTTAGNDSLVMVKGEKMSYTVSYKNMGQKVWQQTGLDKVELKRRDTYNLTFKASLANLTNKPGEISAYNMTLSAPTTAGTYTFAYLLVRNDKDIISGSQFNLVIKVVNNSQEKAQVQGAAIAGPVTTAKEDVKTTSYIAPSNLMEICLSLKNGNYKTRDIAPGFLDGCLKIGINLTTEITTPVVPAAPPNNNSQPSVIPAVPTNPSNPTTNPQTNNGPLVRIGLYYTSDPIVITANGSYKIKDQNQAVLASVAASVQSVISFNFPSKTYSLAVNGTKVATSSYLRFEPDAQSIIMEIVSFDSRPAWNTSLNDNRFLGILEVRYASSTNRLWVINELPMENYLKGLAESSNSSPMEYQKALLTAARSYAMYHYNRGTKHAAENFTLDATYDQVYRGYNSQIRLTQVSDAVDQTRGQMVTYNGQVVVTPYFSYSDGRTRSWQEVWGGSGVPWCISVKEPAGYDKTTMYGHGVGMSARGAILLAAQYSYTFEQILKYYYTGVQIQKIY